MATSMSPAEKTGRELLKLAGITPNGKRPFDIQIHDPKIYSRVIKSGVLGFGEGYMDGQWSVEDLEELIYQLDQAELQRKVAGNLRTVGRLAFASAFNLQNGNRAHKNARSHYDIGNDLYEPMLGRTMLYTCAYWKGARTLDEAQDNKADLVCRKLELKKGETLLDVGCGWGGISLHAARKYGAKPYGVTPAIEQVKWARDHSKGTSAKFDVGIWQDIKGKNKFDKIAAIGVMEHVGPKNYKRFLTRMHELLKDDGVFVLHTIGGNAPQPITNPWTDKYIFPGGALPTLGQMATAGDKQWIVEDVQNLGPDYVTTLRAWYANFKKSYSKLDHDKYDERFFKMWEFYLLGSAAGFRVRNMQLYQLVMRKLRPSSRYDAPR